MLSEQSTPKSKCVVWVDSKNDPEYIKYQNQYNLYLRGKLIVDYFKQNPNATNSELNLKEVELEKKYDYANAEKFIEMSKPERLKYISEIIKMHDDDESSVTKMWF